MAKVTNIKSAELDRRPTRMEINFDAPHVRLIIETGVTVLGQRHASKADQISLNGQVAADFISMMNINIAALEEWIIQDLPLEEDTVVEPTDDYVGFSEEIGNIVEEQKVKAAHRSQAE
ncbi:MAG: hypothetical protein CMB80_05600 [Flammeovirgaceae bacterium]|nr:hypothetical protein [Flammeovirgaceae bacterium]|tara:strand:+ start:723 stop:1079 length:357 start_codon:yes stop_codon:yes gene_type:complete